MLHKVTCPLFTKSFNESEEEEEKGFTYHLLAINVSP